MIKNVDFIDTYVKMYISYYSKSFKDNDMKITFSKNKKELVSKLWTVKETNSEYLSNNTYYLLLLSQ